MFIGVFWGVGSRGGIRWNHRCDPSCLYCIRNFKVVCEFYFCELLCISAFFQIKFKQAKIVLCVLIWKDIQDLLFKKKTILSHFIKQQCIEKVLKELLKYCHLLHFSEELVRYSLYVSCVFIQFILTRYPFKLIFNWSVVVLVLVFASLPC